MQIDIRGKVARIACLPRQGRPMEFAELIAAYKALGTFPRMVVWLVMFAAVAYFCGKLGDHTDARGNFAVKTASFLVRFVLCVAIAVLVPRCDGDDNTPCLQYDKQGAHVDGC